MVKRKGSKRAGTESGTEKKDKDFRVPASPGFKREWLAFCAKRGESSAGQIRAAMREYMKRHGDPGSLTAAVIDDALPPSLGNR